MKNILFLVFLSLVVFNSCINDGNDCFRVTYSLVSAEGDAPVDANRYNRNDIVVVLDTDAVRPSFDFTGWNTEADGSGDAYLPGDTFVITGNVTLYAQWEPATVEIIYLDNEATGGPFIDAGIPGELYTVLTPVQAGISRDGFDFITWNTESDGSGTSYSPETVFTVQEGLTLYALWTPIIEVTFISNGGTGGPVVIAEPFGTIIIPTSEVVGISRDGFILTSWNTRPDGSGTFYSIAPFVITENITLYAQWTTLL